MAITTEVPQPGRTDALDLELLMRVSESCRRAQKLRTLARIRLANARIRAAYLQRRT